MSYSERQREGWCAIGGIFMTLIGLLVGASLATAGASAEEIAGCTRRPVVFDSIAPINYATVTGEAGSKAYLHTQYPAQCAPSARDPCESSTYVLTGDVVAVGKTCGAWAYVQYIGSARVTESWMEAHRLQAWSSPTGAPSGMTAGTSAQETARYRFRLVKGRGVPVCEAYLQRLNQTNFHGASSGARNQPFCGRPENDAVPGFARLTRVPLTAEEVNALTNQVYNFTHGTTFEEMSYVSPATGNPADKPVRSPTWPLAETRKMLNFELFVWRYQPDIDIDNDGSSDNVMVWQGEGAGGGTGSCGTYGLPPTPQAALRQAQLAYVMTPDGKQVDMARTRAIFGHPVQAYSVTGADGKVTTFLLHFRPIGSSIGIFKYRDLYYFDSFFDIWGDFADQRRDRPALANNLAVFLRRDGTTHQICEYHTDDQDYPERRTWEVLP